MKDNNLYLVALLVLFAFKVVSEEVDDEYLRLLFNRFNIKQEQQRNMNIVAKQTTIVVAINQGSEIIL